MMLSMIAIAGALGGTTLMLAITHWCERWLSGDQTADWPADTFPVDTAG